MAVSEVLPIIHEQPPMGIETQRRNNLLLYRTLTRQKEWSISELAEASGLHVSVVSRILHTLEGEGHIELAGNRVIVKESIQVYGGIWDRYWKVRGLFRTEILELVRCYSLSYVAKLLGYGGNASKRNNSLRGTLKKLGWLEG